VLFIVPVNPQSYSMAACGGNFPETYDVPLGRLVG
jgi:hypothetical protein